MPAGSQGELPERPCSGAAVSVQAGAARAVFRSAQAAVPAGAQAGLRERAHQSWGASLL